MITKQRLSIPLGRTLHTKPFETTVLKSVCVGATHGDASEQKHGGMFNWRASAWPLPAHCTKPASQDIDDFEAKKDQRFRCGNYDKAALVIRAECHGASAASGRPKPLLELSGRFCNSISDGDLYYQPDVRRVGYTGRGFQHMQLACGV